MSLCFFVTDLHGREDRYEKLFRAIRSERPAAVFLGGDLLPHACAPSGHRGEGDFVEEVLIGGFSEVRASMGSSAPLVFLILGNDDGRAVESRILEAETRGIWIYIHRRRFFMGDSPVYGYAYVPPTPFQLKDWERYDVSRFVDVGCVSPEEGVRTVPVSPEEARYSTMAKDLDQLAGGDDLESAIFLFHTPPYGTVLDRADLDGRAVDHVPLDCHVGSVAIRRFLEARSPRVSLHGHIHEAARLTGTWRMQIGRTWAMNGAHDGPELALIRFRPEDPASAGRELI